MMTVKSRYLHWNDSFLYCCPAKIALSLPGLLTWSRTLAKDDIFSPAKKTLELRTVDSEAIEQHKSWIAIKLAAVMPNLCPFLVLFGQAKKYKR
ncbi:hypothetical protein COR50_15415 [Chitinophaga caeni]|uniref:Uncharacterized protein n=1 Tax=Chitinophaga caeni TaxID=2029983 RepID=A0A291QWN1_9BACT|nr:hypothetical protein COR50_15415 [Chitinophaga caeni]